MKDRILLYIDQPRQLEELYRSNKPVFRREFKSIYPTLDQDNMLVKFWNERLSYETDDINWGTSKQLLLVIFISLLSGLIAKLPTFLPIEEDFFYPRNIGFIVFPFLMGYFAWKNKLALSKIYFVAITTFIGLIFINALPALTKSDTLTLSCIHLVLVFWSVLGFSFTGGFRDEQGKRLAFLKYNGDLIVMTTLILIAGALMSGITVGLFTLIGLNIAEFYFKNIAIFGLSAAPLVATYLTQTNPQLVGKVAPVIAKLFSPLVLVMLVSYLIAISYSGKNPYNDRDFLLIFNALLIGVMAIIFFSVAESTGNMNKLQVWVLFLLSLVTTLVNCIALSAILFRISEWGITPNRAAVLGGNILILLNLLLVTSKIYKTIFKNASVTIIGNVITVYLPVYFVWTVIVTFIFPFLFDFK